MLVIYAVLVPYISNQKREFIFVGSGQYNYMCAYSFSIKRNHFAGNLSACVIYGKSKHLCKQTIKGYKLPFVYALTYVSPRGVVNVMHNCIDYSEDVSAGGNPPLVVPFSTSNETTAGKSSDQTTTESSDATVSLQLRLPSIGHV